MTFLQPFIFWGLPLLLVPVIIHLLNRLRHRPHPWAAMRFLLSATRSSISNTKLRQMLILLCRVLIVAMLLLFLGRPLAGGWLGWALSPAPDSILILLDRSASMETKAGGATKREQALELLAQSAKQYEEASHLTLIDSASLLPQEIAKATNLTQLSVTKATDTAADIPTMLRVAFNWLIENRAGAAEIWIASDGQRSNWQPQDSRWKSLMAQLGALSQKVRVRLLILDQAPEANASVSLREVSRREHADKSELQFVLDLQRNRNSSQPLPITLVLDGAQSQTQVAMEGQSLRWRHKVDLGAHPGGGWGSFALPADANLRDNTAYFVYGPETPLRAIVVSSDAEAARCLQFGAASRNGQPADLVGGSDFAAANLDGRSLVVWQDPLPQGTAAERLQNFVAEGGVAVFFAPGQPDARQFDGLGWGEVQNAEKPEGFRILRWNEEEGPLAKSDERISLPLQQTSFQRRQLITGQKDVLASFEDGSAFLVRQSLAKGEVYFCASLPNAAWSSLADGPVLVPLLQRVLEAGARRLQQVSTIACGELPAADQGRTWVSVDSTRPKDIRFEAGVYKSGDRLLAVNRPSVEDEPEIVEMEEMKGLFGGLALQMFQERRLEIGQLQGEIWRLFVFAMLLFVIAEGILILPARQAGERETATAVKKKPEPEEQLV
jgi:hypothetical protein